MIFHLDPSTVIQGKLKAVVSLFVNDSGSLAHPKSHVQPNCWTLPSSDLQHVLFYKTDLVNIWEQGWRRSREHLLSLSWASTVAAYSFLLWKAVKPVIVTNHLDATVCSDVAAVCLPDVTNSGFFWFWQSADVPGGLLAGPVAEVSTPHVHQPPHAHAKGHPCYRWNNCCLLQISNKVLWKTTLFLRHNLYPCCHFLRASLGQEHYFQERAAFLFQRWQRGRGSSPMWHLALERDRASGPADRAEVWLWYGCALETGWLLSKIRCCLKKKLAQILWKAVRQASSSLG